MLRISRLISETVLVSFSICVGASTLKILISLSIVLWGGAPVNHSPFRSSHGRCSMKKIFLKISQNSQENTCARVRPATLLKKRLWHRCFPVNFAKVLRTSFLQNTSGSLFLPFGIFVWNYL